MNAAAFNGMGILTNFYQIKNTKLIVLVHN